MWRSSLLTVNTTGLKINCTSLYSILRRTITIFLVQKDLDSAEIGSVELAFLSLTILKAGAEMNFGEDDSLFYSSSKKKYQQNWHPALEANILSFC